jgi:hypothetical protein
MQIVRRTATLLTFVTATALVLLAATTPPALPVQQAEVDWSAVAQALGRSGSVMAGGVYRVGLGRSWIRR